MYLFVVVFNKMYKFLLKIFSKLKKAFNTRYLSQILKRNTDKNYHPFFVLFSDFFF